MRHEKTSIIPWSITEDAAKLMIVCSCNVLSDHDVRSAVKYGDAGSASEVYGCLGCSVQCGRCARTIKRIVDDGLGAACPSGCGCTQCIGP